MPPIKGQLSSQRTIFLSLTTSKTGRKVYRNTVQLWEWRTIAARFNTDD